MIFWNDRDMEYSLEKQNYTLCITVGNECINSSLECPVNVMIVRLNKKPKRDKQEERGASVEGK